MLFRSNKIYEKYQVSENGSFNTESVIKTATSFLSNSSSDLTIYNFDNYNYKKAILAVSLGSYKSSSKGRTLLLSLYDEFNTSEMGSPNADMRKAIAKVYAGARA